MDLKIAACSDIHFHQYTNGLTLEDVVKVGDEFVELCKKRQVDMVLFGGDITLSRNPMYEVTLAILEFLKKLSALGIPVAFLIGNHDRVYKSDFKVHSLKHVSLYPCDYPNIIVMAHRSEYAFNVKGQNVVIHAVPAGHQPEKFDIHPNNVNICMFHDIIVGSRLQSGMLADKGLSVTLFNDKQFDLVLGGDNHKRQEITGITGCLGMYLGAPQQHNWGDAGDIRGYTVITMQDGCWHLEFVPSSSPTFHKEKWHVDNMDDLVAGVSTCSWPDGIVNLTVDGPAAIMVDLDVEVWKNKILKQSGARMVDLKLNYTNIDANVDVTPTTDGNDWVTFLESKSSSLAGLDVDYLGKLGLEYINGISDTDD